MTKEALDRGVALHEKVRIAEQLIKDAQSLEGEDNWRRCEATIVRLWNTMPATVKSTILAICILVLNERVARNKMEMENL